MITSQLLPTNDEFDAIRDRLLAQVDEFEARPAAPHLVIAKVRPPRPRRRVLLTTGSIAGAGALACALVLTGGFGIAGGIASAQADTVLHQASQSAFVATDPLVGPGQYLKFETHEVTVDSIGAGDNDPVDGTFTESQTWTVYEPGTKSDDWYLVRAQQRPTNPVGGKITHDYVDDWKPSAVQNGVWAGKYGKVPNWPTNESEIQAIPHTVGAVRAYLYAEPVDQDSSWSADQQAWQRALDMLTFMYLPAELRGDLYEAMTTIPGVTVTQNNATVDGRTGVAIGYAANHNGGQSIVIDPTTGQYLGSQEEGDVTSVTISVVDAAPKH